MTHPRLIDYGELPSEIWSRLAHAADEPAHPMHLVTMATVGPDRRPTARLMTLRGSDRDRRALWFHTDARSPKAADLRVNPFTSIAAYDPRDGVQLRISGSAAIHTADPIAQEHWEQVEMTARTLYGSPLAPGHPLPESDPRLLAAHGDAAAAVTRRARANFAVIELIAETIDWFQASTAGIRRAVLHASRNWAAEILAP